MRYIFAYRIVGVVSLPGASFSNLKYAVSFSILYTSQFHKAQSIFYLLFSFAFSNNSMTLCLLILESASPNLDGKGAKDPDVSLFMWDQV